MRRFSEYKLLEDFQTVSQIEKCASSAFAPDNFLKFWSVEWTDHSKLSSDGIWNASLRQCLLGFFYLILITENATLLALDFKIFIFKKGLLLALHAYILIRAFLAEST